MERIKFFIKKFLNNIGKTIQTLSVILLVLNTIGYCILILVSLGFWLLDYYEDEWLFYLPVFIVMIPISTLFYLMFIGFGKIVERVESEKQAKSTQPQQIPVTPSYVQPPQSPVVINANENAVNNNANNIQKNPNIKYQSISDTTTITEELKRLKQLNIKGEISDEEFAETKEKLLKLI